MRPVPLLPSRPAVRLGAVLALLLVAGGAAGCRSGAARPVASSASPTPRGTDAARGGEAVGGDVLLLAGSDFVARVRAAERLVARGPDALGELGAAGDLPVRSLGGGTDSATRPVVAAILAKLPDAELAPLLASGYPSLRRGAAAELGQRDAWAPVPALIEGLADADPGVREASHAALKRLTGEVLDPAGSGSRRDRWRAWWSEVGRAKAAADRGASAG
jgi:hypothetical protein